ncbi:hypothetical protein [Candidatus Magnetaquicoccus inordinatus]|uniref:hypothetical protein n=1 Tax=Candidatus Magnetaquicoccus inordinatus TaxID=2496818 RepID=UPI00102C6A44|nr:hypothetical protein [Candidatus Magnetaquicoccus inordinatus]
MTETTMQDQKKKFCPLIKNDCLEEQCAWFVVYPRRENLSKCSILHFASSPIQIKDEGVASAIKSLAHR